eukprot:CAMPEP_0113256222 /NCGR_PEP_ID=MMETSP0008_2-20120614/14651_1 /TAXON_ID=97485 /ORGANISM="Prymnesium parvum" /LENGTH=43 /DNA_ID=CAMNT_0000104555 /DNA_START=263 /DNA_END=391 /DNA_ORIENTATION=+ /assembly_acc=CAM_ASM_000153
MTWHTAMSAHHGASSLALRGLFLAGARLLLGHGRRRAEETARA